MTETIEVFEPPTPAQGTPPPAEKPVQPPVPAPDAPVDAVMDALMARIRPVSEAPIYQNILIYGPPGGGKTKFIGEAKNALMVDCEKGGETLLNHESTLGTDILEFRSIKQLELLIDAIHKGKFPQYKVLLVDSGTVLLELALRQIIEKEVADPKKDKRTNVLVPELQDYNQSTNQLKYICGLLRDAPIHTVMTAQIREEKDDSNGRFVKRPGFTDKLNTSLLHLFSTIGYLTSDETGARYLQVHPTPGVTAKTRIGGLNAVIKNPNINDLLSTRNDASNATSSSDLLKD